MDKTFDVQVMAFLEGSMDNVESAVFLESVHADPEKLDVFTQYRQLGDAFELSRRPIDIPIELQRTIAARIPVLRETLPPARPLAKSADLKPVISRRKSRRVVIALGLLLLAALSYISMDHHTQRDRADATQGSAADARGRAADTRDRNNDRAQSQSPASENDREAVSKYTSPSTAPGGNLTNPGYGSTGPSDRQTDPVMAADVSAVGHIPDAVMRNAEPAAYPLDPIAADPDLRMAPTVPTTEIIAFGFGILPHALSVYIQSGLQQPLTSGTIEQPTKGSPVTLLAGARYEFVPRFFATLEIGQSAFLQETLHEKRITLTGSNNADLLVIDRALFPDVRNWLRLQFGYQLIEMAAWQIEVRGGSGILFGEEHAVLFTSGVMAQYSLSQLLQARVGIQFNSARLEPGASVPSEVTAGDGIIGIIQNASSARRMTSNGVEFNLGFGLRLW
ncbi:MAG: hypothetical protein WC824_00785 [Bacteroidota bacterium]